ncbi:glycosyltransferase family 2 protein [Salinimonas lutimaris]|uniref:glycosyltransferase family 2 protein n=1 Tax=Salinimonas lutimaris TaxID=914153 RepID=UPI0010BFACA2|nr:galactosyltransferase-related protein [Salinimonas lutimaris]
MQVSLFTLVKNRTEQLQNLITHLEKCSPLPDELNVIWMRPPCELSLIKSTYFTINHKFMTEDALPIFRAKNKGLDSAKYTLVGHIGVDVLPSFDFISKHLKTTKPGSVSVSSSYISVKEKDLYLGYKNLEDTFLKNNLDFIPSNTTGDIQNSSLFFIHREDIKKVGGYDENLGGFGINDDDFFRQCKEAELKLERVADRTFCQYRANYFCPVNHLLDFTHNASLFHKKWGAFPEVHILETFAQKGFINEDFKISGIHIVRMPTQHEVNQSVRDAVSDNLPASTLEVAV